MPWPPTPVWPFYALLIALILSPVPDLVGHWRRPSKLPQVFLVLTSACALTLALALLIAPQSPGQAVCWPFVVSYGQPGIGTCLLVDRASLFLALTALLIALAASIYALGQHSLPHGYCVAFSALTAGMVGVLCSGDLLTFYVFWEMMCLAAYALVALGDIRERALEAAWKYFIMGSIGAVVMLFGMALLYGLAGTLNMPLLARRLAGTSGPWLNVALTLFLAGAGVEAALVPFHTWLPDAYSEAPTPVSATLAGITTEIGFYGLLRAALTMFHGCSPFWQPLLAAICVANMFIGNLSALVQTDIKRLLAYSSIGVIGYLAAALVVSSETALTALLFIVLSHGISKALAFLSAGTLTSATGSRDIGVLGSARPIVPAATAILVLSLVCRAGLPGTSGFVEKVILLPALFSSAYWWLGLVVVVNVIIAAAAYFRVVWALLREAPALKGPGVGRRRVSWAELTSMLILSALVVVLGVWPDVAVRAASLGARDLADLDRYARALGGG